MPETKKILEDLGQRDMTLLYGQRYWSLALLRIFLGIVFAYHGALRLLVPANLSGSIFYFTQVGIPHASFAVYLFGIIELAGGLLLFFGLLTRWSAFIVLLEMIYVFFKVHLKNGILAGSNGYEFALVLIAGLTVILASGAGKIAVGKVFKKKIFH